MGRGTVSAIYFASRGDQNNYDGDTVSLSLAANYHGSGTLSYSATGLPDGLSISSTTGLVSGSVSATADADGPFSVTVTATDGTNTANQTFNWNINPVVTVDSIDDQSNADGDAVSVTVSAGDALNRTLTYSASGLPAGLNMDSTTGVISGTINDSADVNSPYAVAVTASDGVVSVSQSFNWVVTAIILVNPGPQSSVDGQTLSLAVSATDVDGNALTFSAPNLPPGLTINAYTGVISGTLTYLDDEWSPYMTALTVSDGAHAVTGIFAWTVTKVGVVNPGDQNNQEGDNVSLQLAGTGIFGTLTYSASGLPDGLSINPSTGLISGSLPPGAAADGPFSVTIAVSDGTNAASQQFTWNVNPVVNISALNGQSNNEGDSVSLQVSASDALGRTLTYSADGLPNGVTINPNSGLISGTVAAGDSVASPSSVTVAATDGTYSGSQTFNWNILVLPDPNNAPPTLVNPGTQSNQVADNVDFLVSASDTDGGTLTFSANNLPDGLSIDPNTGEIYGTIADDAPASTPYAVSVTVDDANGGSATQTFNWFVNPGALNLQVNSVTATEGVDTGNITVATFTTPDLSCNEGDFTALVDWGDGTSDAGIVVGGDGSFWVTDHHSYNDGGNEVISVTIDNVDGSTVTETAQNTALVADAAMTLTGGFEVGAIENQQTTLTLAAFTDQNQDSSAIDFTATVAWGDGTPATQVSINPAVNGLYQITAVHTYTADGSYAASVTLRDDDGNTQTTTSTVAVGNLYAGVQGNLTLASFSDTDPNATPSDFTVTLDWGDGNTGTGTVTQSGTTFIINGNHTYPVDSLDQPEESYQVGVSVHDVDGGMLTTATPVEVVRPPIAMLVANLKTDPAVALTNVQVASFSEPDTSDTPAEFSVSIDWGDGTSPTSGTIVGSNGVFSVLGSHTYTAPGQYDVDVVLNQSWSVSSTAMTMAGLAWVSGQQIGGFKFADPAVSGKTVSPDIMPLLSATSGGFFWPIQWELDNAAKNGGWIIQEVTRSYLIQTNTGKQWITSPGDLPLTLQHYYEAWYVPPGATGTNWASIVDNSPLIQQNLLTLYSGILRNMKAN